MTENNHIHQRLFICNSICTYTPYNAYELLSSSMYSAHIFIPYIHTICLKCVTVRFYWSMNEYWTVWKICTHITNKTDYILLYKRLQIVYIWICTNLSTCLHMQSMFHRCWSKDRYTYLWYKLVNSINHIKPADPRLQPTPSLPCSTPPIHLGGPGQMTAGLAQGAWGGGLHKGHLCLSDGLYTCSCWTCSFNTNSLSYPGCYNLPLPTHSWGKSHWEILQFPNFPLFHFPTLGAALII